MAVAVICEFNPFHNGHRFLLSEARRLTGGGVIAVMSGDFTQRGELAVCSKFDRARAALNNGADLVAELPAAFAVSSAERFARGGVGTARLFGCVDHLAFGCEDDDLGLLKKAAFARDDTEVNKLIAGEMSSGSYYPRALDFAVRQVFGDETADILSKPNNILACEYIRALSGSGIEPLPVKRRGAAHDSDRADGEFASASYIRRLLRSGEDAGAFLPEAPREITYPENLNAVVMYRLRSMTPEELRLLPDVSEGLENRIISAARSRATVDEVIDEVKTKRYTRARIGRIITCALLGITEELQNLNIGHVRVLGFTPEGEKMLGSCSGEIVTSVSKSASLGEDAAALLAADIRATDTAALGYGEIKPCGADYLTKIIKVNSAK